MRNQYPYFIIMETRVETEEMMWDRLFKERAKESDESATSTAREAIDLRFRLVGIVPGLEMAVLRDLRDSVEGFIEAIRFHDREKSKEALSKQLTSLAQHVGQLDDNPSAGDVAAISTLLSVLDTSGQADQMVTSLRDTFSRPNLVISVGEPLVQTVVNQDIQQIRPVRDCILGTRIFGEIGRASCRERV